MVRRREGRGRSRRRPRRRSLVVFPKFPLPPPPGWIWTAATWSGTKLANKWPAGAWSDPGIPPCDSLFWPAVRPRAVVVVPAVGDMRCHPGPIRGLAFSFAWSRPMGSLAATLPARRLGTWQWPREMRNGGPAARRPRAEQCRPGSAGSSQGEDGGDASLSSTLTPRLGLGYGAPARRSRGVVARSRVSMMRGPQPVSPSRR